MLCAGSVRAVFVGVLFTPPSSIGWKFCQETETCPNFDKITTCQDLKSAENSNCWSSTGFGPTLTTMTKLLAGWPTSLTQMSASFPATVCRISNLCSGQRRSQSRRGLQIVALCAVLFVDCAEYFCVLVGFLPGARLAMVCILYRLSKVRSLIEWKLSSFFRICCKNPIIRNLNFIQLS